MKVMEVSKWNDELSYETAECDDDASQAVIETDTENEASNLVIANDSSLNWYLQMEIPRFAEKYMIHNKNNKIFFGDPEKRFKSGKVFVKDQESFFH